MKNSMKSRLMISALALFVIALGINVLLNSTSVDKLYEESTISQYRVIGEGLQRKVEKQLSTGHNIFEIEHLDQTLTKTKKHIQRKTAEESESIGHSFMQAGDSGISVSIAMTDGAIAYSADEKTLNSRLSEEVWADFDHEKKINEGSVGEFKSIKHDQKYYLTIPVRDESKSWVATIVLTFPETLVKSHQNALIKDKFMQVLLFLGGGIILLILSLNLMTRDRGEGKSYPRTKISLMMFFVICSAQIAFSGLTTIAFKDLYLRMNKEKARMSVNVLQKDLELFIAEGQGIGKLSKGEVVLRDIINASPELNDITIFDSKWHPLFMATKKGAINCQSATYAQLKMMKKTLPKWDPKYNVRLNVIQDEKIEGYISTNISKSVLFDRLIDIALDSMTVLIISILFLVEMLILIFKVVERKPTDEKQKEIPLPQAQPAVHYGLMRPAAFMLLFGIDISISFLPLHMEKLYAPLFGLSKDVVMGLPISVEFLFVGICILVSGVWLDRRGWHEPFLVGVFLAGVGILYSWGAPDALHFIISRGIVGIGYGLALMASQGFVIEYSDERSKAQGLAHLFAGIYAGSICGGATGAMLADRFGYSPVFFSGSLILFAVIGYTFIFMRNGMRKPRPQVYSQPKSSVPVRKVGSFLSNRIVISLILFSSLPAAIAVVGFLNYFSPIYLNRIGASQSTIGRVLMIYGICLIYIGPFISKYVDASNNKRMYIFIGSVLGSLAFLTFNVVEGLIAAAAAVLLLGLSSSFVLASQSAYILKLKVTERLGAGKSIGIFRSTSRGGQVLGPIVFSSLIVATNITDGITYFGLAYLLTACVFFVLTQKDRKMLVADEQFSQKDLKRLVEEEERAKGDRKIIVAEEQHA